MGVRNLVFWNMMIDEYMMNGEVENALQVSDELPTKCSGASLVNCSCSGIVQTQFKLFLLHEIERLKMATHNTIAAFICITGALESFTIRKLEEYKGNLSGAVNTHFLEMDTHILSSPRQLLPPHNIIGTVLDQMG
ncbi:hypothetical protein RJT34_22443 [Clitoria ternatea]|uniref:Uncharacterized protein n=1 Tax=Clitoria ternatea TaxID=43366 RepID=A0AAN9P6B5_CLITE